MKNCDKDLYASLIAGYLVGTGALFTTTGNCHIPFAEINNLFELNLPDDKEMLDKIVGALNPEIVADVEVTEDFDLMLYTSFCPSVEDE